MALGGILAGVGALGGVASSLFGGGGISGKEQRNNFRWSVNELDAFNEAFQNSPALANVLSAFGRLSADPFTFDEATKANLKARYAEDAVQGGQSATKAAWERSGAIGGYRDSSTRAAERNIALRQGSTIAQGNREVDQAARASRGADVQQIGSLLSAINEMRLRPLLAETGARLGSLNVQASQNPFQGALQTLGSLGVGIGTAQRPYTFTDGKVSGGGGTFFGDLFSG